MSENTFDWRKCIFWVVATFIGAKIFFLMYYTINREFIMDEFSQAYKWRLIGSFYESFYPIKNVLYAYVYALPTLVASDTVNILMLDRLLSLSILIITLVLLYKCALFLYQKKITALVVVCLALSVSTLMEHGFRIRSETVSLLFTFAGMVYLLKAVTTKKLSDAAVIGFFLGLGFLCTQKNIFFIAAFFMGLLLHDRDVKINLLMSLVAGLSLISVIFIYALFFNTGSPYQVLSVMFFGPADLAVNGGGYYSNLKRHIANSIALNQIFYGMYLVSVLVGIFLWRKSEKKLRATLIVSLVLCACVIFYDQSWPYMIAWIVPNMALLSGGLVEHIKNSEYSSGLLVLSLFLNFPQNIEYAQYKNNEQLYVSNKVEELLSPEDLYSDGIGMVLSRDRVAPSIGLDAMTRKRMYEGYVGGDKAVVEKLLYGNAKVWIDNYRLRELWSFVGRQLEESYERIYPNILLAGKCYIGGDNLVYENLWAGTYSFYDLNGKPLKIDFTYQGQSKGNDLELGKGMQKISLGEKRDVCLFPKDLKLSPLKLYKLRRPLFAHSYD